MKTSQTILYFTTPVYTTSVLNRLFSIGWSIGLILLFGTPSKSQTSEINFAFQSLTESNGLSEGTNAWIHKDESGYVWISSMDGLNRFDGTQIKKYRYDPSDSTSLGDNIVTSTMYEDQAGNLWFSTYRAINVYLRKYDSFRSFRLEDPTGREIVEDYFAFGLVENQLWIRTGLRENGLWHTFDIHTFHSEIQGPLRGQRIAIHQEESGNHLFFSSRLTGNNGFLITSEDSSHPLHGQQPFGGGHENTPAAKIYKVLTSNYPTLYLASDLGLILYNCHTGRHTIYSKFEDTPLGKIKSIVSYKDYLYTSSENQGLLRFNTSSNSFESQLLPDIKNEFSLRRNNISSLFIDRDQCLWLSYFENGLREGIDYTDLKRHRFDTYKFATNNGERAFDLASTSSKTILIGAEKALIAVDENLNSQNIWTFRDQIKIIKTDPSNGVWTITQNPINLKYTIFYKPSGHSGFEEFDTLEIQIEDLLCTQSGSVLLATTQGIFEKSEGQFSKSRFFNEVKDDLTFHLFEDAAGNIYISTNYDRLYVYTGNSVPQLISSFSGVGDCKSIIDNTKEKTIWVASSMGLGSIDYSQKSFEFLTPNQLPLPQQKYFNLQQVHDQIWVKTERGLFKLNTFDSTTNFYSKIDGVVAARGKRVPSLVDSKGRIWISGSEGINIYHPDSIVDVPAPPTPQISAIHINDAPYKIDSAYHSVQSIPLNYNQNTISFEFVPCQYGDPKNIQYQYRLVGYEETWVNNVSGYARYYALPPGEYRFEARTGHLDNQWSPNPRTIAIKIAPPFWATPIAYFFYACAFLALLWYIRHRERIRQGKKLEEERRKVEQERLINEELRKIDKLKDQFLANTSHELRTPLNGIIGLAESLIDGATGTLSDDTKNNLVMIASSGKRLANLVNDILDFSKIKSKDLKLNLKSVDLYSAVDIVMALLNPLRINSSVDMINKIPRDFPLALADEDRLQQILYNLIGNAIKFTRQGEVMVSAEINQSQIQIQVSDTGIGIPENELENIFRSFEQVDGSESREFGGAGLGLSVTKQLVELHEGEIFVQSKIGVGSQFFFSLQKSNESIKRTDVSTPTIDNLIPAIKYDDLANIPTSSSRPSLKQENIKILIVDDEPINRQVLQNHLSTIGYQCVQAADGEQALHAINSESFSLVLLDIMMPGLSGFEVCQKIRETHSPTALPIIMLTAKNRVSDLVQGFTFGANDYLTKPFSKDELMARIETHLSLGRIYSATGKFVPYAFLNAIGRDHITQVKLGDHTLVEVTVLFADIRDFTRLSESMTPTENFNFVNTFVGRMGPVIQKHGGFVNQYLGDGIMAIFPESSQSAIDASKGMMRELNKFNLNRKSQGEESIRIGIGLHTGPLIMGIIGDENRTDPATIADTVNTSSRLEGLTKYYKANIIVSEDSLSAYSNKKEEHFRFLGKVKLKGKAKVTGIYECIDVDSDPLGKFKVDHHTIFHQAMDQYQNGQLEKSLALFTQLNMMEPSDLVVHFFLTKIKSLIDGGLPPDWEAIETMNDK